MYLGGLGLLLQPGRTELSVGASTIDVGSASHFRMVQVYDKLGLRMPGRGGGNCPVQGRLVEAAIQATDTIVENVVFVSRLWCIIPVLGACLSRQSFLDTGSLHHHHIRGVGLYSPVCRACSTMGGLAYRRLP